MLLHVGCSVWALFRVERHRLPFRQPMTTGLITRAARLAVKKMAKVVATARLQGEPPEMWGAQARGAAAKQAGWADHKVEREGPP